MKFRTKILVSLMLVLSLSLGIGGTLLIRTSFRSALEAERHSAVLAYQMTASVLRLSSQADTAVLGQALRQTQQIANWDSVRLCQDGKTVYQLGSRFTELLPPESAEQCASVLFDDSLLQLTGLVSAGGQTMELSIVWMSAAYSNQAQLLTIYHTVFLSTITIGSLLCWVMAHLLTRPLSRMSRAARKIAAGDLSVRVEYRGSDEVGQLSADFDHMAHRLEENIRAMEESMRAQEQFMGSFAHELKTPMTSIIGYADLLRTQSLTEKEAQEASNYIFSEAKRLEGLGLKLLELLVAKNEKPVMVPFSVPDMVYGLVRRLKPIYQSEGIHLSCQCQAGFYSGEEELLCTVLINLLDNARKAMTHGGKIHIIGKFEEGVCKLCVVDNGRGIPPEALSHLSEAFYRVDKSRSRAQGGAGLGLALCQQIVAHHGGKLTFYSKLGEGTCAMVILPAGRRNEHEK